MPLPTTWKPIAIDDLIRVGGSRDGGYVMPARLVPSTDILVGFGLCDEWSFEADMAQRKSISIHCYDHTVDSRFLLKRLMIEGTKVLLRHKRANLRKVGHIISYPRFFNGRNRRHYREMIGEAAAGCTDLTKVFRDAGKVKMCSMLLRIDIEGAEYDILPQILNRASYLCGLIIEFHSVVRMREVITQFLADIASEMSVCHIHANNGGRPHPSGRPDLLEMTLINNKLLRGAAKPSALEYPVSGLDYPNDPTRDDFVLAFG